MVKAKTKTKSAFLNVFRATGKKAAAFKGDVMVDGAKKKVRGRSSDASRTPLGSDRVGVELTTDRI